MKKILIFVILSAITACSDDENNNDNQTKVREAQTLMNVAYGSDPQQLIDIYLPERKNDNTTKVLFLVHGGGWSSGSKEDMTASVAIAKQLFPDCAFVNINYRLATQTSPAYPKQIDDLKSVVAFIRNGNYAVSEQYAFLGVSAGAHLSMLYAYGFDPDRHVKAVCSIVGPTDFNDPAHANSPLAVAVLPYLTTDFTPQFLTEVSPISHVSAQSAPTIQFMGNVDQLVPTTQGQRLKTKLDSFNVPNELHIYNAGHGNFSVSDTQEIYAKLGVFFKAHF